MMIWPPAAFIFYLVASLGALAVDGSILSPSEFQEVALQTLARHATSEKQMRDFASTHSSFTSIFAACDNSSSTMQPTTYSALECACGCGGWTMDFSSSSTFCSYQSFTEAMTACFSSDAVDDCETYCSGSETVGFFEVYDCLWALDHALYWASDVCSDTDSLDSSTDSGCEYVETGNIFFDNDTTLEYRCDGLTTYSAAFPSITVSSLPLIVSIANAALILFFGTVRLQQQ